MFNFGLIIILSVFENKLGYLLKKVVIFKLIYKNNEAN